MCKTLKSNKVDVDVDVDVDMHGNMAKVEWNVQFSIYTTELSHDLHWENKRYKLKRSISNTRSI